MVKEIKFKNYKIFKDWQKLEIRPINILIGKNNSGKSAIAKILPMLSNSLSGNTSRPVNWINRIGNDTLEIGSSFEDLVYNRNSITSLDLIISNEVNKIETSISKIGFLEYKLNDKEIDLETTKFKGFLPDGREINKLNLNIDYIGAFRIVPEPNYPFDNEEFTKVGINGRYAYNILIQDSEDREAIVKPVSDWYKSNFEGWSVEILKVDAKTEIQYQIVISNNNIDAINLIHVGQGIHQILPLIVRSFMPVEEETLIIIEEPETHLHPAAHGNLAQRFADSYLQDKNKNYLIETHSQNFVLRLRRLIAEGVLKTEDLAIYYVDFNEETNESKIRLIEVGSNGGIPNKDWPKGIFSETSLETRAIHNAYLNNLSDVGRD